MKCPGCEADAFRRGYAGVANENWTCGSCGRPLKLDEYANVICERCNQYAHITQMTLSCNSGRHRFYVPDKVAYSLTISTASNFVNGGGIAWLQSVIRSL